MEFTKLYGKRKPKAALYVRVSTLYQIDKDSLPFQKQELENYCKYALNIEDVEIFEDAGYSGKNTDRPAYQRMMARIRRGEFTHVCVWKIDRISRNLLDFAGMYEELKKHRVTFVSKNEQFDTSSAMGEAMLKIILIFAELERKLTSERVTGIMLDRATKGLWNGARMPLGYKWSEENKYPVIDDAEKVTIQFIYDKYEEVKSCLQISRMLNNNNIKTKRGGEWTSKTVCDIIRNPFYKGTYRYNYRESARGAVKDESEWIVVPNNHPGIISEEQWERCNRYMDINKASKDTANFYPKRHTHIFAGVLKCAECGRGFSSNKDKPRMSGWRPSAYRCDRGMKMRDCAAPGISDVVLGPFVFNYIANFVRIQRKGGPYTAESIEKALLSGKCFSNVAGIDSKGIQDTLRALSYTNAAAPDFVPDLGVQDTTGGDSGGFECNDIEILRQEEEKLKNALQRLLDLYLFDSAAISQQSYITKKEEIEKNLKGVQAAIEKSMDDSGIRPDALNTSFMKKASAFIVNQRILSKKEIDFEELACKCDANVMKDLIAATIEHIDIRAGRVEAITFKSGLVHRFKYKE